MKSYTDIEQSKKLVEILPLESADMWYQHTGYSAKDGSMKPIYFPMVIRDCESDEDIPCWSLAALLGVLPLIDFIRPILIGTPKILYICMYNEDLKSHAYDNPVDACYEMILKLNELKML